MAKPLFNWYTYSGTYLSLRNAAIAIFLGIIIGVLGFAIIEDYTLRQAFYMTVITLSTVGFSEVKPLSAEGQLFTAVLIIINIGIVAYSVSSFTGWVVTGELFKRLHLRVIGKNIRRMKNHIILCGYGRYGREIADHFIHHQIPFVIIERDHDRVLDIQKSKERLLYIEDDATHDEALERAKISAAKAIITSLPDDSDNLFIVISARQLNPNINIISRTHDQKTERKLLQAGANHVIMPDSIGGFYMATLITKPGAVEFFSFITNEYESDLTFEVIPFEDLPIHCQDKSISQLAIRKITGANIIGVKKPEGGFDVNPTPEVVLTPGQSFIFLGTGQQLLALRKYLSGSGK
jgi:voltage-gated potassium channel